MYVPYLYVWIYCFSLHIRLHNHYPSPWGVLDWASANMSANVLLIGDNNADGSYFAEGSA